MLNKLRLRLRALFFKSKMEDELQAELQFPPGEGDRGEHRSRDDSGRGALRSTPQFWRC